MSTVVRCYCFQKKLLLLSEKAATAFGKKLLLLPEKAATAFVFGNWTP